ncbi:hypothetical protein CBR_g31423 [Chara braunii]|uniref:PPIase cyclophilin-type domain-containing protein n=1 Tax=Chara braunii TaxID=69332 RepID=A0A388LF31_CHABU|nr:hypothetical protein CBR_g31423 [Chara braunii]|eukprot:GBG80867.1 hypothetical protein CBR_g31423 [Chara braunii]
MVDISRGSTITFSAIAPASNHCANVVSWSGHQGHPWDVHNYLEPVAITSKHGLVVVSSRAMDRLTTCQGASRCGTVATFPAYVPGPRGTVLQRGWDTCYPSPSPLPPLCTVGMPCIAAGQGAAITHAGRTFMLLGSSATTSKGRAKHHGERTCPHFFDGRMAGRPQYATWGLNSSSRRMGKWILSKDVLPMDCLTEEFRPQWRIRRNDVAFNLSPVVACATDNALPLVNEEVGWDGEEMGREEEKVVPTLEDCYKATEFEETVATKELVWGRRVTMTMTGLVGIITAMAAAPSLTASAAAAGTEASSAGFSASDTPASFTADKTTAVMPRAMAITAEEETHAKDALQGSRSQSPPSPLPSSSSSSSSRETLPNSLQEDREDIGLPRSVRNIPGVDSTITSRVFMDFGLCPTATRSGRTLGNRSIVCDQPDELPLGRVVIGLYGKQAPQSVANFVAMCNGSAGSTYAGTLIHRIVPGQFIQGGKLGAADKGEVMPPSKLSRNQELVSPSAFKLRHTRPGTVSLCLSVNDDTDAQRKRMDYQSVEFLITTGAYGIT